MKPTRRGLAVVAVVGFCVLMAWQYGARALNALVAPLVVVLAAALVTVYLAEKPTIWRQPVEEGFIGDRRDVGLDVEVDSPTAAVVADGVDDGLEPAATDTATTGIETTLRPGEAFAYEVELVRRGERTVGPATVTVRDVLGLVERTFEYRATESVLVYPEVFDLRGGARHDLQLLADAVREYSREEFDHLREYRRGDSPRDIDWKSTAKRPDDDLVVKEFVADEDVGTAEIVAECTPGNADEMATAAASVATYLLEFGVSVGVAAPDGRCRPEAGSDQHLRILRLLARSDAGDVRDRVREGADVLIRADADGTVVRVGGDAVPFERFAGHGVRRSITGADPGDRPAVAGSVPGVTA